MAFGPFGIQKIAIDDSVSCAIINPNPIITEEEPAAMADRLLNPRKKPPKSNWCRGFIIGPKASEAERAQIESRMMAQDIRNKIIKNTR